MSEDVNEKRNKMVSSINVNIPAAGLGSRPASIISTTTLDEGGFNEPSPEIKAKLRPHVGESIYKFPSPEAGAVVQQKSIDSDVMYHMQQPIITNSVLAELEDADERRQQSVMEPLYIQTTSNKSDNVNDDGSELLLLSKLQAPKIESEPFIVSRTVLLSSSGGDHSNSSVHAATAESPKSEASILDLQDVEYADASDDEEEEMHANVEIKPNIHNNKSATEAEAMTPAEAENLLSTRYNTFLSFFLSCFLCFSPFFFLNHVYIYATKYFNNDRR